MLIVDMPAMPLEQVVIERDADQTGNHNLPRGILLAGAAKSTDGGPGGLREISIKGCTDVMNPSGGATNGFGILRYVYKRLGMHPDKYEVPVGVKSRVVEAPKHGKVSLRSAEAHTYEYEADPEYFGQDTIVFRVEVKGKRFRLVFNVMVVDSETYSSWHDEGGQTLCESKKLGSLDHANVPPLSQPKLGSLRLRVY